MDRQSSSSPMNKYGSRKPSKDDPYTQAVLLARKMYMLDGFTKNEIGHQLADRLVGVVWDIIIHVQYHTFF